MSFTDIDETYPRGTQRVSILDDGERETRAWMKNCLKQLSGYPDLATPKIALWTTATRPTSLSASCAYIGYNTDTNHLEILSTNASGGVTVIDTTQANKLASHPVGSYLFTSDAGYNPNTDIGGSWVKDVGEGRCFISAGNTYTGGSLGGEFSHTLTIAEMPAHSFSGNTNSTDISGYFRSRSNLFYNGSSTSSTLGGASASGRFTVVESGLRSEGNADDNNTEFIVRFDGNHGHYFSTNSVGSNIAHNNMPPYQAVYIWHRVA